MILRPQTNPLDVENYGSAQISQGVLTKELDIFLITIESQYFPIDSGTIYNLQCIYNVSLFFFSTQHKCRPPRKKNIQSPNISSPISSTHL